MPVVVTAPPLIATGPEPLTVTLVKGVPPPTIPVNVVVPDPCATVKVCPQLTVFPKLTLLFVVVSVALAPKVTAPV